MAQNELKIDAKKLLRIPAWILVAILLLNFAYFVKTLVGIKLTNQPHHGWLFPIADKALKFVGWKQD